MTEQTDTTGAEYEPGTREAAVLLIKAAAVAAGDLDKESTTDAEVTAGLIVVDHAVRVASAHALLAVEARLAELVEVLRLAHTPLAVPVQSINVTFDGDATEAAARVREVLDKTHGGVRR